MKIKVLANELLDSNVQFVSLVKHGAIRSPFKILKEEDAMKRNARREELLARRTPQPRNTLAEIHKATQRASDVGVAAVFAKDTADQDPQPGRYGFDPLQANTDATRTAGENASVYERLSEIRRLLEQISQALTSERLASEVQKLETARARLRKAERALEIRVSNAFRGGNLDWLEDQGRRMVAANEALLADHRLNELDESLGVSRHATSGIQKADKGDTVLDDALASGMGVQRTYRK